MNSGKCLDNWVWTFSGFFLSRMKNAAVDVSDVRSVSGASGVGGVWAEQQEAGYDLLMFSSASALSFQVDVFSILFLL